MSVMNMSFEDASFLLNDIHEQVTGAKSIAPVDTAGFISMAQNVLKAGYDPVLNALRQTVTKTIFSIRNYDPKLRGIQVDRARFGAITRKINFIDDDFELNPAYTLEDGAFSPDMFTINKPKVFESNFYGANTYKRHYTVFRNQLDNAFSSPEQFGEFMSAVATNNSNVIKQSWESICRLMLGNLIAGKVTLDNSVIHVLTEYNEETGNSFTQADVKKPENFDGFVQWLYARISNLSDLMEERSQKFQVNIEGKEINRHTPKEYQRLYFNSQFLTEMTQRVVSDVYHDSFLRLAVTEGLTFWQDIEDPYKVSVKPSYMNSDGTITESTEEVEVDNVIGVMFDRDALAMSIFDEFSSTTPFESRGDYWNLWWTWTVRWAEDMTEKSIIILFD